MRGKFIEKLGIAMCVTFALVAIYQLVYGPTLVSLEASKTPDRLTVSSSTPVGNSSVVRTATEETYAEIDRRPLFVPGRRSPVDQANIVPMGQATTLDKYAILGIIAASERSEAILRGPSGETLRLRVGQSVEGWTLEKIQPKKLLFGSSGLHQEMDLKIARSLSGKKNIRTNMAINPQ